MKLFFNAQFYRLSQQVERIQPRERILIIVGVSLLVFGIGQGVLTLLNLSDVTPIKKDIETLKSQISMNEQAIATILSRQNSSKLQQLKAEQLQLKVTLDQLVTEVKETADFLIPPTQMPVILRNLLQKHSQLELIEFNTQAPVRVETANNALPLFSHGLTIRVNGSFRAMTSWLKEIEQLPWVLNWDHFDYRMEKWPVGKLTIEIHTLSREEVWLDL